MIKKIIVKILNNFLMIDISFNTIYDLVFIYCTVCNSSNNVSKYVEGAKAALLFPIKSLVKS